MLILEGSDHLGKTTVAKKLVERAAKYRPAYYAHMGRPPELFDFRYDYLERMAYNVVQDRFHLGALVWHEDVMTKANLNFIESQLEKYSAMVVVLYHGGDYERHLDQDERNQLFDRDHLVWANHQYRLMAEGNHPLNPKVDAAWDVQNGWVLDRTLSYWVQEWIRRGS